MGHVPRHQFSYAMEYAHLKKEVVQLQEANNVLNSELHRAKELLRDALPAEGQLAEDVEDAEDRLWSARTNSSWSGPTSRGSPLLRLSLPQRP